MTRVGSQRHSIKNYINRNVANCFFYQKACAKRMPLFCEEKLALLFDL
jgi:hypothetical protein